MKNVVVVIASTVVFCQTASIYFLKIVINLQIIVTKRRHIVRLLIVFAGWIATTMLYYGLSLNASNLGNKYKLLILSLQQQKLELSIFLQENNVVVQIALF
jgi:hypothetical protein